MKRFYPAMALFFFAQISINILKAQDSVDTINLKIKTFELGEIIISATIDKEFISSDEMEKFNKTNIAASLNLLPSLVLINVGSRNEGTVYLRGFDIRSIPVYADGIPIYVPYDGYLDLARFTTNDLAKIEVSKGFSSILYGPNTIGGAINLISSKPVDKIEILAKAGVMNGNAYNTSVNIGSNLGKIYFQGNFSKLKREYFPLSADFDTSKLETNFKRDNSYSNDEKVSVKIGFTPNKTDEYSINYIYQHGEKGNPIYLGNDNSVKIRYWQWPYWDKESVYFISKTIIALKNYIKTRFFYDRFKNQLNSYDDNTYTTQNAKYAFQSFYNDYSLGTNFEAGTELINKNNLKIAGHFKNDIHRENSLNEPVRHISDNTFSVGIEDEYNLVTNLKLVPGISYNIRKSLIAENYNSNTKLISNFPENKNTAINSQIGIYYKISEIINLSFTVAHKTRFATMKDRYSYRLGTAIPNPDLKAETAMNYEFTTSVTFFDKITLRPEIFYSKLNNTIQMVDNVQPGLSQMQNTGTAEFTGADFSLSYKLSEKLNFNANYSYIERHNLTAPDIKFTDVPKHKIFGFLDYRPMKKIDVILSCEYDSERFSTSYGIMSPGFTLFNSHISARFTKYFKIETGINNILDRNYSLVEGYPEAGRNYYISLLFNFNK